MKVKADRQTVVKLLINWISGGGGENLKKSVNKWKKNTWNMKHHYMTTGKSICKNYFVTFGLAVKALWNQRFLTSMSFYWPSANKIIDIEKRKLNNIHHEIRIYENTWLIILRFYYTKSLHKLTGSVFESWYTRLLRERNREKKCCFISRLVPKDIHRQRSLWAPSCLFYL